ncbi:hypothetical protein [Geminicoccus roseus]|jgi:predicted site-specific integrase-resolvase|uniref:hypothetical protein n=1 Tax=Geminicoccus roseus TaxID=404900 RepID=UPI000422ECC5|nr:hypothetical protein [Geminicoccus roseus]
MSQSVQEHRRRLAARGFKRVELALPESDAELVRAIAKVLVRDDDVAEDLRAVIQRSVPDERRVTFKEWLESND